MFARGAIQAADVRGRGATTITLSGVQNTVNANLKGITKLYIDAASGVCFGH